jgi:YbbR domain-containing protein
MTLARGILIFLGALLFSVVLWAYVRLSSAYEADVDLPIKLTAPKGYALASGLPERLHTRVRGAGWQILLMNFTKNANFQFDLTERALPPEELVTLHSDEISNGAVLPSELRILKVEPDSLELQFGKAMEKRVTVEPRLDVQPARGYIIVGEPVVTPRSVSVVGAGSVLDSLTAIPTQSLSVRDAREDVDRVLPLTDSLDNVIAIPSAPKISVHVSVQAIGERKIAGVPVIIEALPPQFDLVLLPGTITVTVRGGVEELAKLAPTAIQARVMYNPMILDSAQAITPHVDVPKGLTYLASDPPNLRFIVRRKSEHPLLSKEGAGGGNAAH